LRSGWRQDDLTWSIQASDGSPNIISELSWRDLDIIRVIADVTHTQEDLFYLKLVGEVGWSNGGSVQDSDYNGNDRTLEFSRSDNGADGGEIYTFSAALGYPFQFFNKKLKLAPLIGYAYREQNLKVIDGLQTVPPTGPFNALHSTYDTQWRGPWAGLDVFLYPNDRWTFFGGVEYHWDSDYDAQADWNLRSDFKHPVSFTHTTGGQGIVGMAGASYHWKNFWWVDLAFDYQTWDTEAGLMRFHFVSTDVDTRFNGAQWDSFGATLAARYVY